MEFKEFRSIFQQHVKNMIEGHNYLFVVDVDKDMAWETYLDSFPQGTNEIFRERRAFDCSCCKSFMRQFANVVVIADNKLMTAWDFQTNDATYQPVINALSALVKSALVKDVFITKQSAFGTDYNHEQLENKSVHTWSHFRIVLPEKFVTKSQKSEASLMSEFRDVRNVFERSLKEISKDVIETVLDLIVEKSLYKGEEWKGTLEKFLELHNEYRTLPDNEKDNWCWVTSARIGGAIGKIRNHSIGVLLQDLSDNTDVIEAIGKYEYIVAPQNYKHPKAIFTKKMVEDAESTITRLGLLDSLGRRHAGLDDITINNVIWANKDAAREMKNLGVFEVLKQEVTVNPNQFGRIEGTDINKFIESILPSVKNFEVLLENHHQPNLMSLIAPKISSSPTLFKWENGFSWAYNGNLTDSMKQRVKAAGGNVTGILRFSLQWNDDHDNRNDYDAHCREPGGFYISFRNMRNSNTGGVLDVDIQHPLQQEIAVENITWNNRNKMQEGVYEFYVHNYSHRGGRSGFDAEIEYDGQVYEFAYHKDLAQDEKVLVAKLQFSGQNGIKFLESLPSETSSKTIWELKTNQFHQVSVCTLSPNYWDEQCGIGHRHYLFMLGGCKNEEQPNGFFNEYLQEDFMEHKRVFAALGSQMKVAHSDNQLSGLGFSSTKRNSLICKVDDRLVKIIF